MPPDQPRRRDYDAARHRRRTLPADRRRLIVRCVLAFVMVAAVALVVVVLRGGPAHETRGSRVTHPGGFSVRPSTAATLQTPIDPPAASAAPGVPVEVSVPRLGIASALESLGLEKDGSLKPPSRYSRAGWYAKGPRPGEVGPAVIAGHVDSVSGPAIFFALDRTRAGDEIDVRDAAGTLRRFEVTDVQRYHKARFPTAAVYGPTPRPVLRLITCTGSFDARKRSYVDNLVVSATLQQPRAG